MGRRITMSVNLILIGLVKVIYINRRASCVCVCEREREREEFLCVGSWGVPRLRAKIPSV